MKQPNFLTLEKKQWHAWPLFLVLLAMLLCWRYLVFAGVALVQIDSDQPFMWAGAMDYAAGLFYEPRFYGQNYNTFFEGLFAVPLIRAGLPVYQALPLATQFIFLFPFIFSSVYLMCVGKKTAAFFVLAVLLCLPTGYDVMSSMPRGFVGGLFFCSFYVLSVHRPENYFFLAVNMVCSVLGYFVNPNMLLVAAPFMMYVYFFHYRHKTFYMWLLVALLLFVGLWYVFDGYYTRHPERVVYAYAHSFSWNYFIENVKHLDATLAYVSFFVTGKSILFLLALIGFASFLFRHNLRAFYALMAFVGVMMFSFFSGKSRDGVVWPWYAYSRLFIGLPMVYFLLFGIFDFKKPVLVWVFFLVAMINGTYKVIALKENMKALTDEKLWNGVHLVPLPSVLSAIDLYRDVCKKNGVDFLLISNGFWLNTYLDYGGPAVYKDFSQTYETRAERRYWVREKLDQQVPEKFIFISAIYDFDKKAEGPFQLKKLDDYGLYLVEGNTLTTKKFIDLANKVELSD